MIADSALAIARYVAGQLDLAGWDPGCFGQWAYPDPRALDYFEGQLELTDCGLAKWLSADHFRTLWTLMSGCTQ